MNVDATGVFVTAVVFCVVFVVFVDSTIGGKPLLPIIRAFSLSVINSVLLILTNSESLA